MMDCVRGQQFTAARKSTSAQGKISGSHNFMFRFILFTWKTTFGWVYFRGMHIDQQDTGQTRHSTSNRRASATRSKKKLTIEPQGVTRINTGAAWLFGAEARLFI